MNTVDKGKIARELRGKSSNRHVCLPRDLVFCADGDTLTLSINGHGMGIVPVGNNSKGKPYYSNMQDDAAAFEGWALVLKTYLPYKKIVLNTICDSLPYPMLRDGLHYNRFLYRAMMFEHYYNSWFKLSAEIKEKAESLKELCSKSGLLINNRPTPQNVSNFKKSKKGNDIDNIYTARESQLEEWLSENATYEVLGNAKGLYHQLPMGIFVTQERINADMDEPSIDPCESNALFTHARSAVDLWALVNNSMHIFELKKSGNRSVGALSELFFYACVCKDLFCSGDSSGNSIKELKFKPLKPDSSEINNRGYSLLYSNRNNIRHICAQLLYPDKYVDKNGKQRMYKNEKAQPIMHPLIGKEVFALMQQKQNDKCIIFGQPLQFNTEGVITAVL